MLPSSKKHYSYASDPKEEIVLWNSNWKTHAGIPVEDIITFTDKLGDRTQLKKLLSVLRDGDVLAITSVAALEDNEDFSTLFKRLKRLKNKGVILKVVWETEYDFYAYQTLYNQQFVLEEQRHTYKSVCLLQR